MPVEKYIVAHILSKQTKKVNCDWPSNCHDKGFSGSFHSSLGKENNDYDMQSSMVVNKQARKLHIIMAIDGRYMFFFSPDSNRNVANIYAYGKKF